MPDTDFADLYERRKQVNGVSDILTQVIVKVSIYLHVSIDSIRPSVVHENNEYRGVHQESKVAVL